MTARAGPLGRAAERKLAASLFNRTWDLLVKKRRSAEENDQLLHAAHASTYHWYRVGTARNFSIAEWQLSRVYAVLRDPDRARHHAERALELARAAHLAPFYVAYGHEALARAHAVAGERALTDRQLRQARRLAVSIRDAHARRLLEDDLASVHPQGRARA